MISIIYSDRNVHMWPHTQTQTLTRGSKNSFSFPARISTSNHCIPEGMTHVGLTNDSDFLLQPPKHSCCLLSSPQRGVRAEEKLMKQTLVYFSSLLSEDITTVFPLQRAGRRKEQTDIQVSPSWPWIAGTQTISAPTLSSDAFRSQWLCSASPPIYVLLRAPCNNSGDVLQDVHKAFTQGVTEVKVGAASIVNDFWSTKW